jgi:hypothetical protein
VIKYCMSLIRCSFKWAYDTIANANLAMKTNSKLIECENAFNIFADSRVIIENTHSSVVRKDTLK